jgi:hypothetical protein
MDCSISFNSFPQNLPLSLPFADMSAVNGELGVNWVVEMSGNYLRMVCRTDGISLNRRWCSAVWAPPPIV